MPNKPEKQSQKEEKALPLKTITELLFRDEAGVIFQLDEKIGRRGEYILRVFHNPNVS